MNRYLDRLTRGAQDDTVLAGQFLRVAGFVDPPSAFFRPAILRRVLLRRRARQPELAPAPPRVVGRTGTGAAR
jgi:hypothetical protein